MSHKKKKAVKVTFFSSPIKIFIGIIALLLIIIVPFSIYFANQQKELNSNAAASTTLAFSQPTVQVSTGAPISLPLIMTPGNNAVSLIQLVISYDSSTVTPNSTTGFQPNITAFPTVLDGPTYGTCNGTQCTMSIALSIGNDVTKAITTQTTIATLNFTPVKDGTTQISIDPTTQIFSVASGDQASENVLSSSTPTVITIGTGTGVTLTSMPISTITPTPSVTVGAGTPTATIVSTNTSITPTPSEPPTLFCRRRRWGRDKDLKKVLEKIRNKLDDIDKDLDKIAEASGDASFNTVRLQAAQTLDADLTNTQKKLQQSEQQLNISGIDKGGCVGSFDPNNPDAITNCDQLNNNNDSGFQAFINSIGAIIRKIFGGN